MSGRPFVLPPGIGHSRGYFVRPVGLKNSSLPRPPLAAVLPSSSFCLRHKTGAGCGLRRGSVRFLALAINGDGPNAFACRAGRLCSRQESNLERRYRKPIFYPLNYGSKREIADARRPLGVLRIIPQNPNNSSSFKKNGSSMKSSSRRSFRMSSMSSMYSSGIGSTMSGVKCRCERKRSWGPLGSSSSI